MQMNVEGAWREVCVEDCRRSGQEVYGRVSSGGSLR